MQTFCHQVIFNTEVAKKEVQHSQQSLNSVCHTHETKPGPSKVGSCIQATSTRPKSTYVVSVLLFPVVASYILLLPI